MGARRIVNQDRQHERAEVFYSGRVQGVGFRFTATHMASDLAVTGFVRNLADGRVQLVAEGPASDLKKLLARMQSAMGRIIREARTCHSAATGEFGSFSIRP